MCPLAVLPVFNTHFFQSFQGVSSVKEDNRSGRVDGSEKADGAFVVAGGERTTR